ncbi:MAG TPA: phytanoyl-CoA dioxygenase family protein [Candidatus Kapabacteria bacterium]|nr:phytanoyl-CoA dioxygenase family protein [Candidatus Kapabacteria bacterium]
MLSTEQIHQYHNDGFLIVRDLFTNAELQPVIDAIDEKVDALARKLYAAGQISDLYDSEGFLTRLSYLELSFPGSATLIHTGGTLPHAFANIWSSQKLLDIIEQLLGPEIAGHPVWNLRSKTPHNPLATVPWHQDTAYLAAGSEQTFQPTAWIPLVDANEVNGCMQVVRGGHRGKKVFQHYLENTRGHKDSWYLYIDECDLPTGDIITCTMNKGSVLLLNNLIPHRSTENFSNIIRWSIDLRWQRPKEPSGMEGIKEPILMRTAGNPSYRPNWSEWAARSRQVGLHDVLAEQERLVNEGDTKVSGPWMDRWRRQEFAN